MDGQANFDERVSRRVRINSLMAVTGSVRTALGLAGLPPEMRDKFMVLEDEAWRHLRAELNSHFAGRE